MSSPRIERKLAAIMFTDIAGYTAQMSKDEAVAISLLNKQESILKPLIAKHNGTYVKSTGDGSLSHFNSAVDAATCAKRFQESIYDDKDLNVRVGVHLGDTIFEKGDIRGDGVNIASRLESMAVEGSVFVSKEVHDQLSNQKEFEGVSLGLQSMKGVGRLIEVYGLKGDKLSEPKPSDYQDNKINKHSDDEVPSIAIIPFDNKGADEDVFYAYGISTDLISDCSSAGLIRVAGLKDIEGFDYKKLQYDELASKLFVRYVSHGSLWKVDNMFQLSIELYDTKESKVVWSDRWEENWDNLSNIKGNLSDGLLKALDTKPKVEKNIETANTKAYEFYLKGKHKHAKRKDMEDSKIAIGLLNTAIEIDTTLLCAKQQLGWIYYQTGDVKKAMGIFQNNLKEAELLGDIGWIAGCLGSIATYYRDSGNFKKSLTYSINSIDKFEQMGNKWGIAEQLTGLAITYFYQAKYSNALEYWKRSFNIFKQIGEKGKVEGLLANMGNIYTVTGELDKALRCYQRSLKHYEKIGDKMHAAGRINNIGIVYNLKGDYDKALEYNNRSLIMRKEINDVHGLGYTFHSLGRDYWFQGEYNKALKYCKCGYDKFEEIDKKGNMSECLHDIGCIYYDKGDYSKAKKYLEQSLFIKENIGLDTLGLEAKTDINLICKKLKKDYDENEIYTLIKETENIKYYLNLRLYELLEDTSYLETAYNEVQEIANNLEPDVAAKFLSYPIPKAIVEEWERVK